MKEFSSGTMNERIFKLNAPYNNPYQGSQPRWLFVCSAGLLRSPTGAVVAHHYGINARACGATMEYALIPISANLIMWAEKIVFVCPEVHEAALRLFKDYPNLVETIEARKHVLDIPDMFPYMDAELVAWFERELFSD